MNKLASQELNNNDKWWCCLSFSKLCLFVIIVIVISLLLCCYQLDDITLGYIPPDDRPAVCLTSLQSKPAVTCQFSSTHLASDNQLPCSQQRLPAVRTVAYRRTLALCSARQCIVLSSQWIPRHFAEIHFLSYNGRGTPQCFNWSIFWCIIVKNEIFLILKRHFILIYVFVFC